jgi:DUF438 domain-containing protein
MEMNGNERKYQLEEMINLAMDLMEVAVTIIDTKGTLLYYNQHSAKVLDRKPVYIGADIHSHHKDSATNNKVDTMLKDFEEGRREPFHYEAKPYGEPILVTLSPIIKNGEFIGCVHVVIRKENTISK